MSKSIETIRRERLTKLLRVVERHIGQRGKPVRYPNGLVAGWDMETWKEPSGCKTVGCALGSYLMAGHGGNKFHFESDGVLFKPILHTSDGIIGGYDAAAEHFHISCYESVALFDSNEYAVSPTPACIVARRVRSMIRKYDEGMGDMQREAEVEA